VRRPDPVIGGTGGGGSLQWPGPHQAADEARLRYQYQNAPPASKDNVHIVTPRADKPFSLGGGWSVAARADLPTLYTQTPSRDNLDGHFHFGMVDVLLQALFIKTERADFAWELKPSRRAAA
jgi:hypothetical protein